MRIILTRRKAIAGALAVLALPAYAAPQPYVLVKDRSTISFGFDASGAPQTGTVPVETANISVDPRNLAASSARVTADVRQASTGLIFATQAMKSKAVLDADNHPIVSFTSQSIQLGARGRISEGAKITGRLTLRGVTKTLELDAVLSRPAGSSPDDLSVLFVKLSGALSRSAFGATGFADLVADTVTLDIRAEIRRQS